MMLAIQTTIQKQVADQQQRLLQLVYRPVMECPGLLTQFTEMGHLQMDYQQAMQ